MPITEADLSGAYRRLERPLYNVLLRLLWDPRECQDIQHEAFMKVWAARERVRIEELDQFIYASALNLARNQLRWRGLRRFLSIDSEPDASEWDLLATVRSPELLAEHAALRHALGGLSQALREVLLLSEFSGFDTREIATLLGIAEGTVGSRKHEALRQLRLRLGGERSHEKP